ncbi:MAG: hypothetical protein V3U32_06770 [Anaerolineales bacterium]
MGDVFRAYKFLNDGLKLDLSDEQLARMEHMFRLEFAKEKGYSFASGDDALNWEFFAHLGPRVTPLEEKYRKR